MSQARTCKYNSIIGLADRLARSPGLTMTIHPIVQKAKLVTARTLGSQGTETLSTLYLSDHSPCTTPYLTMKTPSQTTMHALTVLLFSGNPVTIDCPALNWTDQKYGLGKDVLV